MARRAIGIVAVLMLAAIGVIGWLSLRPEAPSAAAQTGPQPIPVTAGVVTAQDVPVLLHGIGTAQAYNMVSVKSRVDGQIIKIDFKEGQEVKQGDPLIQIDPRPYEAALEQAQATKQKDEAQLAGAQLDLARFEKLLGSGYQTRQSYDNQKALVAQLQAAIKGDEAQINTAKLNLSFTDIRSPIDGRLGAKLIDKGNLVRAGDNTTLVTIAEVQPIFVNFTLPQAALDQIRENQQKAPLVVQAYSGDDKKPVAEGKLTLIDNTIEQATGTIRLKARFDNEDESLWPGEFVRLQVIVAMRPGVATVPSQTVQEGPNGHYAYIIKPDDTVERRAVDVASIQDGIAVVTKGLSPGERVVVSGQYRLTQGVRVKVSGPQMGAAG
jgi:membrane fusion protein, multidrug efflux system